MKPRNYVKLVRPPFLMMAAAVVLASYVVASEGDVDMGVQIPVISVMLFHAAGIVLNDFVDADRDKGRSERPIAAGSIERDDALFFGLVLYVVAMTLVALSRTPILVVTAGILSLIGLVYNFKAKGAGFVGNVVFGFVIVMYGILGWGGFTSQISDSRILFLLSTLFLMGMSTTATNDFINYARDVKHDYKTLPTMLGVKKAATIVTITRYLLLVSFLLLLLADGLIHVVTLLMITILAVLATIVHKRLISSEDAKSAATAFKMSILFNMVVLLGLTAVEVLKL